MKQHYTNIRTRKLFIILLATLCLAACVEEDDPLVPVSITIESSNLHEIEIGNAHRLSYQPTDANDPELAHSIGSTAPDVGLAMLLALSTDRRTYPDSAMPVLVEATIYADQATTAELTLGQTLHTLNLITDLQTVALSLTLPIAPGEHDLVAVLDTAGLTSTAQTHFSYGVSTPDLIPGPPRLLEGDGLTRTLQVYVRNDGGSPSGAATVALWDGDPSSGGTLIGEASLPALQAGDGTWIELDWEIQGQGGPHTLYAIADPASLMVEFDEDNNSAPNEVLVPRFALQVATDTSSYDRDATVPITVEAINLQPDAALDLNLTMTVAYEFALIAHQNTLALNVPPGESASTLVFWEANEALGGQYGVHVAGQEPGGEPETALTSFTINNSANFFVWPLTGTAPLTVYFENLSTPLGGVHNWQWNFGDASPIVTETNPIHVYQTPGSYSVTLTSTVGLTTYVEIKPDYITVLPGTN